MTDIDIQTLADWEAECPKWIKEQYSEIQQMYIDKICAKLDWMFLAFVRKDLKEVTVKLSDVRNGCGIFYVFSPEGNKIAHYTILKYPWRRAWLKGEMPSISSAYFKNYTI